MKLTSKLLFPLGGLVIVGLGVAILTAYVSAKNGLEKTNTANLRQISVSAQSKVSHWMGQNTIAMDTWSRMDVMADSLDSDDTQASARLASAKMKHYIDTHKVFSGMRLTNDKGIVIASSHAKNVNKLNVSTRSYFKASMTGTPFTSELLLSKTSGKPILVISSPVKKSGRILGVLYAVVEGGGGG